MMLSEQSFQLFMLWRHSLSHGAIWKALISKYIGTIPLSGDAPAAEHNRIRRSATEDDRQQRHDREGRRGREV